MSPEQIIESLKRPGRYCPGCGSDNNCQMASGKSVSACWCLSVEVPLDKSEDVAFGSNCYCRRCLKED